MLSQTIRPARHSRLSQILSTVSRSTAGPSRLQSQEFARPRHPASLPLPSNQSRRSFSTSIQRHETSRAQSRRSASTPSVLKTEPEVVSRTLPSLLTAFRSMMERGQRPNRKAYLELLRAASDYSLEREGYQDTGAFGRLDEGAMAKHIDENTLSSGPFASQGRVGLGWKIAWSAWEDARLGGVDLGVEGFDLLLRSAIPHPHLLSSLLYYAQANGQFYQDLSTTTYDHLLTVPFHQSNLESSLAIINEMERFHRQVPTPRSNQLIQMACEWSQPKLALDLALRLEATEGSRRVETQTWLEILRTSTNAMFVEGVDASWQRLTANPAFRPDEGLLLGVLNLAGRRGLDVLGTEAIEYLHRAGVVIQEHHLAPMIEAFCLRGKISDAMETLNVIRSQTSTAPTVETAEPIVKLISQSTDLLDAAYLNLETAKGSGKTIDVTAFNAVLKAAKNLSDLGRAIVIWRQASELEITPSMESYHILLETCVAAGSMTHALKIAEEIPTRLGTKWDVRTYDLVIQTCVNLFFKKSSRKESAAALDKAFELVKTMKQEDRLPVPRSVYESLVRACVVINDKRFQLVLEDMQRDSIAPTTALVDFVRQRMAKRNSEEA